MVQTKLFNLGWLNLKIKCVSLFGLVFIFWFASLDQKLKPVSRLKIEVLEF